jgi:hypothetical protein
MSCKVQPQLEIEGPLSSGYIEFARAAQEVLLCCLTPVVLGILAFARRPVNAAHSLMCCKMHNCLSKCCVLVTVRVRPILRSLQRRPSSLPRNHQK